MIDRNKIKRELEKRGWKQVYSMPGSPWKFLWDTTNPESPVIEVFDENIFYTRLDFDEEKQMEKPRTDICDSFEELLSYLD